MCRDAIGWVPGCDPNGMQAKLDGCGNVADTRRDDKFNFCECVAVCVENLHAGG